MINYILQVVLFQVLFLAIYDFFLSKETFFTKNRIYLLLTPILSFIIPLIKIPTFQKAVSQEYIIFLPEIVLSPENAIKKSITEPTFYESVNYLQILFWVGAAFLSILFFIKLIKLIRLISSSTLLNKQEYILVLLPKQTKAFSFFNYVFLGDDLSETKKENIIQHELVHSKQKHTLDLLFFEILKIAMWFNPMIYIYQKRITLVHEFIADEFATKKETKENYINNLLSSLFQVEQIAFVNQFNKQNFLKKRIIMMTKTQSKKMNQLKYLLLIPVLASMLFYVSCTENDFDNNAKTEVTAKKEYQKRYLDLGGEIKQGVSNKKTYLDFYLGREHDFGKEVSYDELNTYEREEFDEALERFKSSQNSEYSILKTLKIYQQEDGRKILAVITKHPKDIKLPIVNRDSLSDGSYSILHVNKRPIFPGCGERDTDCLFKKIDEHFQSNFDKNLPNNLGLSSGRKKAYVSFNIDLNGYVSDIKVRAPHKEIEKEVTKVIGSLPKMSSGTYKDKPVKVRFTLPFVFFVD